MDRVIQKTAKENEDCQRLTEIPGVGPVTATALIAAVGNASAFQKGRNLAAWMGIVPREYSTGGKQKLLGISKRGNKYLRTLFIQGARSVVQQRHKQSPGLSHWFVFQPPARALELFCWTCRFSPYCSTRLSVKTSSCRVEDFETKASAPTHSAVLGISWTLKNTILIGGAISRIFAAVSNPFIPGMLRSRITTSGVNRGSMRIASIPFWASPHT